MKTTKVTVAGIDFIGGKGNNGYFVAVPEIEKALGWRADSGRQKLASSELKAFADKASSEIQVAKSKIVYQNKRYSCISTGTFFLVLEWQALKGNLFAVPFLTALARETFERRIDNALGISVTEETYEDRTKSFFRQLARKSFHPKFTCWNDTNSNYGAMVNEYKRYMSLPLVSIDEYNAEQVSVWYEGIVLYNGFRYEGFCHKVSLEKTRMILSDVD